MKKQFRAMMGGWMILSSIAQAQYSQEIVFKTAEMAPADFNAWTFFWSMPVIDEGASLDYVVIQPDGSEYFQYKIENRPAGAPIRSDFSGGFAGGDPSVFYGKEIVFRVRVTKGQMRFLPDTQFRFEFRKVQTVRVEADIGDADLFVPSIKLKDAEGVKSGVLHCLDDKDTGVPDIFLSNPESGERMNLTKGRVSDKDWSQPWGPVGSPDGKALLFYQFQHHSNGTRQRIWLLEIDGAGLYQLPEPSHFEYCFTWAPKSDAVAYPQGKALALVDRTTRKVTKVAVWDQEDVKWAAWSPDGKWIACGGKQGCFKLVAPDGATQKIITCDGLDSDALAWNPNGNTLAGIVNGALSLISLEGDVVKQYGKASSVNGWSSDGRYIAYGVRRASGERRQWILDVSDGKATEVAIQGDCYSGVWKPRSALLAFWHQTGLMTVGPDGVNPKLFGSSWHGSTMSPSWLVSK